MVRYRSSAALGRLSPARRRHLAERARQPIDRARLALTRSCSRLRVATGRLSRLRSHHLAILTRISAPLSAPVDKKHRDSSILHS